MQESGSGVPNARVDSESGCDCGTGACRSTRPEGYLLLPGDPAVRKSIPIGTAVLDYFPLALAAIARVSLAGQKQHNTTGWDRSKSTDHDNCLIRHYIERGTVDTDGTSHTAKMAWRSLAILELEEERRLQASEALHHPHDAKELPQLDLDRRP